MIFRLNSCRMLRITRIYGVQHFSNGLRSMSSLPNHNVLGMPALSPTMEQGNIAKWVKKQGDAYAPGDIFCQVETDKATVDFEAQDEGFIAKLLFEEGASGIQVGTPILITVDEEESVSKFDNYVSPLSELLRPTEEVETQNAEQIAVSTQSSTCAEIKLAAIPAVTTKVVSPALVSEMRSSTIAPVAEAGDTKITGFSYGQGVKSSPLYSKLLKQSNAYAAKFGSTLLEL